MAVYITTKMHLLSKRKEKLSHFVKQPLAMQGLLYTVKVFYESAKQLPIKERKKESVEACLHFCAAGPDRFIEIVIE